MTREEEINIAVLRYIDENSISTISSNKDSFIEGAKWADEHPKSPWINVEDDLPCNHEELMDGEFQTKFVIVSTNGINKYFELMYNYPSKGWIWSSEAIPKYWMPIPELPKE